MTGPQLLAAAAGIVVVAATLGSAVRTVLLPRGIPSRLTRTVFRALRVLFAVWAGPKATFKRKDRVMALYAPVGLLMLVLVWELLMLAAYASIFWAIGAGSVPRALQISGSSLLTLGVYKMEGFGAAALMYSEAAFGLLLLALLITFMPTLYTAFSRREQMVALLEVRAGSPPSALEMITRYHRIHGLSQLKELWLLWEEWFVHLEETHTSFPALAFFRSPQPEHSWITAAGAVLDAAALRASTIEGAREPGAELCIRAGYIALRRIAHYFDIPHSHDPSPTDPITIDQAEYDRIYDELAAVGVPLKSDRRQAWRDFAGWRVNYDTPLVALTGFVQAPHAPWSSDRWQKYWQFKSFGGRVRVLATPAPWFTSEADASRSGLDPDTPVPEQARAGGHK
ncbi:MAG: hypothetical protein ACRDIU_10580 [Actinomycetota bacterium]